MDAVPVISHLSVVFAVVRIRRTGSLFVRIFAVAIKPASPKDVNEPLFSPQSNAHRLEQIQITVGLLLSQTTIVDVAFHQITVGLLLSQTTIVDVAFHRIAGISVRMDAVPVISNLSVVFAVVRIRRTGSLFVRIFAVAIKPASPKDVNEPLFSPQSNAHRLEQIQ